jgi:hypothetical protein
MAKRRDIAKQPDHTRHDKLVEASGNLLWAHTFVAKAIAAVKDAGESTVDIRIEGDKIRQIAADLLAKAI